MHPGSMRPVAALLGTWPRLLRSRAPSGAVPLLRCCFADRRSEATSGDSAPTRPEDSKDPPRQSSRSVPDEVDAEMAKVRSRAGMQHDTKWDPKGPAYRFRLPAQAGGAPRGPAYDDHSGLRFPTLETAENIDYHKDRGLDRVIERAYPIQVPGYRRLDPYLREYIYFLHNLDPARFSITRIAQRYRMREKTVAKVVQEWGTNHYLTRTGLTKLRKKQQTREAVIMAKKEQEYAKWVGWDQLGDEDDSETDDEAIGDTRGWRSTSDWIRKQTVEVEMMSAFPMMEKRDPMPKRVDVDMVVDSRQHFKIINWIDPTDKVVF
mmetsp:Transcript_3809/g.7946  ORF Transcript_3809/g.7946 Transcript_3809/m.7946 type:complete len:320 (-) Transcript_3809:54-1013(-)